MKHQQMTPSQLSACKFFTTKLETQCRHDGTLTFTAEPVGKLLMVSASNATDLRWFETSVFVLAFIGPRGGVTVKTAEGINPR